MPLIILSVAIASLLVQRAALAAPDYHQCVLQSIYPAGAGRGQTVEVVFTGMNGGLKGATEIIVDGEPGVSVEKVEPVGNDSIKATFIVADDAKPGRRMVRVKGGVTGLTNFRWFFVGAGHEIVEKEKNNSLDTAETVTTPLVINGKVDPAVDQDCFRFEARAGQKIVAAVTCHWLDAMGYDRDTAGFADTSLELLDESGRVVAEAGDTLGFDPLIHYAIEQDGWYTARVSGVGYKGFPQMVYRLTLGEVPYPTAITPVAGRRGETIDVIFTGPNVEANSTRSISIPADDPFPVQYISLDGWHELPLLRRDHAQSKAADVASDATGLLVLPFETTGTFFASNQQHRYPIQLAKGDAISIDVTGQRHLRSPVDTLVEIRKRDGTIVAQNDDGEVFQGECSHDFAPFDSQLTFVAKESGEFVVCVSEQSGASGPRAAYHLAIHAAAPDFRIFQWPDAVSIWGSGTTAAFVVETHRLNGLDADIELSIEGLPAGWIGSTATVYHRDYRVPRGAFGHKSFLTITAPADAATGTVVEFEVIGRVKSEAIDCTHRAQPLTLYMYQEPNHFRFSSKARAVVAAPTDIRLTALTDRITATAGTEVQIPVQVIHNRKEVPTISLSVNRAHAHFQCSLGAPVNVPADQKEVMVPLKIDKNLPPGWHSILVADGWSSETRKGLPGPCTQLITLEVIAGKE
ncbi:MAG: pre-peptidase C-terminal domain-containing protein [Planctomycetota bacterium]|nr:pre-peptidase C-terminal domain-containing protein [Planctomycetota bacterium]